MRTHEGKEIRVGTTSVPRAVRSMHGYDYDTCVFWSSLVIVANRLGERKLLQSCEVLVMRT